MLTLFRKLLQPLVRFLVPSPTMNESLFDTFKIAFSALLAVSVIILQAFITTGVSDASALFCVISLAIAIPFLALYLLIASTEKFLAETPVRTSFSLISYVGVVACLLGVTAAFVHISPAVGAAFVTSFMICILIYAFFEMPRHGIDD